ncbi:S26 family signal peptidase [Agromyces fucosus]|uniref:S26 family signal peptidase n=1 Tax=Agromyces fucosus TaxID=41985 RepID=UPI001A9ECF10|nr:S26 family signal peptidase [Agromyces fucosus]
MTSHPQAAASERRRSAASVIGDVLLTVAAAGGAVCIVLVVAAVAFGVSIMLFATGSMSPAIPAGAAALVREVPVASVEVGDVVTVDRPGRLPITHRVVAISGAAAGAGPERELTLRGDANPVDDPAPYRVSTVRVVLFAVPGVASTIAALGNPLVLGTLTLLASALVVWAFWPRGPHGSTAGRPSGPRHARSSSGRGATSVVAAVGIAVLATSVAASPSRAEAATSVTVVQGDVIRLTSIGDAAAMGSLAPGGSAVWIVGVEADAPSPGAIRMSLAAAGSANPFLDVTVTACDRRTVDGTCPNASVLVPTTPLLERDVFDLGTMPDTEARWLRVEARMSGPDDPAPTSSVFTVTADGYGETVATGGSGPATGDDGLARSGWAPAASLWGAAVAALGGGVLLLVARHGRRTAP